MAVPINANTQSLTLSGPAGALEAACDQPPAAQLDAQAVRGAVVIGHPHPLFAGSMDNKVVHTLARSFLQLGYVTLRFNFRGVGDSQGSWDEGRGEVDDMQAVVQYALSLPQVAGKPLVLAGFSFGAYIVAQLGAQIVQTQPSVELERLALVGVAASNFNVPDVPENTLVIHGEQDEEVPLSAVLDWARPQSLPVVVLPGVGHYVHGKLPLLKNVILRNWQA